MPSGLQIPKSEGTAHYSKFLDVVNKSIGEDLELPEETKYLFEKEKKSIRISKKFEEIKAYLHS